MRLHLDLTKWFRKKHYHISSLRSQDHPLSFLEGNNGDTEKYSENENKPDECLGKYLTAAIFSGEEIKLFASGYIAVYGEEEISEDEKERLALGLKFATFSTLDEESFAVERELCSPNTGGNS